MLEAFFVPGPLPNLNDMLAARGRVYSKRNRHVQSNAFAAMKRDVEALVRSSIRKARIKHYDRVFLVFHWQEANKRRDKDNIAAAKKFILDAMIDEKAIRSNSSNVMVPAQKYVLAGDGWKHVVGWVDIFSVVPDNPGVHIIIRDASKTPVEQLTGRIITALELLE